MTEAVPKHVLEMIWADAAAVLELLIEAGEWTEDPDDPDSWGLERERIACEALNEWLAREQQDTTGQASTL
jgi:hypothetical protein